MRKINSTHIVPTAKHILFFLVLLFPTIHTSLLASSHNPYTAGAYILLASNSISLAQAVNKIKKQTGGRILSAKKSGSGSKTVYVIKVLMPTKGQVRTFRVNANS